MRHDRTGELIDDEDQAAEQLHRCGGGWLDRDAERPRPCLRCRPGLARRPPRPRPDPEVARVGAAAVRAVLANLHPLTEETYVHSGR